VPSRSVLTSAVTVGAVVVCPILVHKKHALTMYYLYIKLILFLFPERYAASYHVTKKSII